MNINIVEYGTSDIYEGLNLSQHMKQCIYFAISKINIK